MISAEGTICFGWFPPHIFQKFMQIKRISKTLKKEKELEVYNYFRIY
jgi:hypothetical protein